MYLKLNYIVLSHITKLSVISVGIDDDDDSYDIIWDVRTFTKETL